MGAFADTATLRKQLTRRGTPAQLRATVRIREEADQMAHDLGEVLNSGGGRRQMSEPELRRLRALAARAERYLDAKVPESFTYQQGFDFLMDQVAERLLDRLCNLRGRSRARGEAEEA